MREIGRREFLITSGLGLVALACRSNKTPIQTDQNSEQPKYLPEFSEITSDLVSARAEIVARDFANHFKTTIDPKKIASETELISNIDDYYKLNNLHGRAIRKGDEDKRPFFNIDLRTQTDKRIFINGLSFTRAVRERFGNTSDSKIQSDVLDAFLIMALTDYLSLEYYSPAFNGAIFGEYLHKNSQVDDFEKDVYVDGAMLKFSHQERRISMFESLEKLEQIVIADYLYNSTLRSTKVDFFKFGNEGIKIQLNMLKELFAVLHSEVDSSTLAKALFEIRTTKGERENLYTLAQKHAGKKYDKVNIFGIAIFGALAAGDKEKLELLLGINI